MEGTIVLIDPGYIPFELLSLFLYAETHYRFRYFLSYLKKDEPEIIADAPFRVEPGQPIPILLLAKDADKYPCRLNRVSIRVLGHPDLNLENLKPTELTKRWWWRVFEVPVKSVKGRVDVEVEVEIEGMNGKKLYRNDNHRTSSKKPLRVYVAGDPLPRFKGIHFGDMHTHSSYTDDQVEFGAPLEASIRLSKSLGLSFFGATDHSYDLDDRMDDYLTNDPKFPKWTRLQSEIDSLSKKHKDFVILRGEEVSCRSGSGHNVHMLLLGNKDFVQGSGDGAEKWFHTRCEHTIHEVTASKPPPVLAFAAHPVEDVPTLQRVLLHRGSWQHKDIAAGGLNGVQFANGTTERGFQRGIRQWVRGLLEGRRLIAVAGNDAHGNFNRFRQIGIPFFTIRETREHMFGGMRTGVFLGTKPVSEEAILRAIRAGHCFITNGPVARITTRNEQRQFIASGSQLSENNTQISIEAISGPEFGSLEQVSLLEGVIGEKRERVIFETTVNDVRYTKQIDHHPHKSAYLRLEVWTSASNDFDRMRHFCLTNPIWMS